MHSWRWFDQWISSSGRGEESYLFFYEIAGRSRSEPVGKIEDAPILNPRWEMQGLGGSERGCIMDREEGAVSDDYELTVQ